MVICSVVFSLYALLLAGLAFTGRIKKIGYLCAAMAEIAVVVALLTKRVAAFALIAFPAALMILQCLPERRTPVRQSVEPPKEQKPGEEKIPDRSELSQHE